MSVRRISTMRALHPHSFDVMRYFARVGSQEGAGVLKKGKRPQNLVESCTVNRFTRPDHWSSAGSYDAGGSYGLENAGSRPARSALRGAGCCETSDVLSALLECTSSYDYLGGMMSSRPKPSTAHYTWIEQNVAQVARIQIDASGEGTPEKSRRLSKRRFESWDTGEGGRNLAMSMITIIGRGHYGQAAISTP